MFHHPELAAHAHSMLNTYCDYRDPVTFPICMLLAFAAGVLLTVAFSAFNSGRKREQTASKGSCIRK